jgi:LysR family glycine cleavage system transcriptional activator
MAPDPARRSLRIGTSQSFAIAWLLPRLARFQARHPDIEVTLHTRSGNTDLAGGSADVGIVFGAGEWPGLVTQKFMKLDATIVSAPAARHGRRPPGNIDDLAGHTLLEPLHPPELWRTWLKAQGHDAPIENERAYFDSVQVMYEACALGLGLAIGMRPLVDAFLAAQRLIEPFPGRIVLPGAYYLAAVPALRRERSVRAFWNWLAEEAAGSASVRTS